MDARPTDFPASADAWPAIQQARRAALWRLLGDLPPAFTPAARVTAREPHDGYTAEALEFDNGAGATVFGYFLLPADGAGPFPAVLYLHAHGAKYARGKDEVFETGTRGAAPGPALARMGYAVLCVDAYAFGQRQHQGPAGTREAGADTELSLFKQMLWEGRSLWGMMVRDDLLALNVLLARAEIDPGRVAAAGMSMGGSRATWLSALDDRIRLTVPIAQMTRYADFAAQGDYALHSIYYYVPGIRASGLDMEHIASLAAPRPQLVLVGDSDPLSPLPGIREIDRYVRAVYRACGAENAYALRVYEGVGHAFTPAMFAALQDALRALL